MAGLKIKRNRQKRLLSMRAMTYDGYDLRFLLYTREGGRCWFCGQELALKDVTVDHVVPVRQGGVTTYANVVASCQACNHAKGARSLDAYRAQCGGGLFWGERRQHGRQRS